MAKKTKLVIDLAAAYFLMEEGFFLLSKVHPNIIISLKILNILSIHLFSNTYLDKSRFKIPPNRSKIFKSMCVQFLYGKNLITD